MATEKQSKMQKYEEIQAMVQKEIKTMFPQLYSQEATKYGVAKTPLHQHNGYDAPKISQSNITPGLRASGAITMATDGATYSLGAPFNATSVLFYGNAIHRTGGTIDIRAMVVGNAQIGPTYYYQPQSSTSVKTGGPIQNVIQSSSYILIDSSTSPVTVRALASETHLVSVQYPGATIAARATITDYGPGVVYVTVELEPDWEINGNFVVT